MQEEEEEENVYEGVHAHIKSDFQMSLKDCCKTMNMHINLRDLYLLSSGIYNVYAQRQNREGESDDRV